MRPIVLAIALLAFNGHGHRMQGTHELSSTYEKVPGDESAKAFAMLLLASNPEASWLSTGAAYSRPAMSSQVASSAAARSRLVLAKDTNAPKRPASAYLRFVSSRRPDLKAEGLSATEITKKAGAEWKALSEKQKKPFNDAYNAAKAEYDIALAEYKESPDYVPAEKSSKRSEEQKHGKKKLQKMLVNQPKRPLNAYMLFGQDKRPVIKSSNPDAKVTQIMKIISEMWNEASESAKQTYQERSEKLKAEYETKMSEYKKSDEYLAYQQALQSA